MACTCCKQMTLKWVDTSHKIFVEKLYLCRCGQWKIAREQR